MLLALLDKPRLVLCFSGFPCELKTKPASVQFGETLALLRPTEAFVQNPFDVTKERVVCFFGECCGRTQTLFKDYFVEAALGLGLEKVSRCEPCSPRLLSRLFSFCFY